MAERGRFHSGRHAGLLVPLFSIPSVGSWGIGEIADLPRFARWLDAAGLGFVQLLPVNEMEEGQSSPYSAMSAMAIDPVFIALADVPEFAELGGDAALPAEARDAIARARASASVDFRSVRAAKRTALRRCFERFRDRHRDADDRGAAFRAFVERERWWIDEYSVFRALHDEQGGRYWRDWDAPLRDRDPAALASARERLQDSILYYQFVQWTAADQWQRARRECGRIGLFGDFQFMVSGHSADVWSRQAEFDVESSVGVPPDAFSETGQDWGLPVYRWDVMERGNFEWLRQRIRRCIELFDGFRIDHLVGFYRTYVRHASRPSYFTPAEEHAQLAQGERLMRLFVESGGRIIAEDLGIVPDFVRASLARLGIPGLKVLRWERKWHEPGQPFRAPSEYPEESVAISGTHDTETLAEWWDGAARDERHLCVQIPELRDAGCDPDGPFSADLRDALLRALFSARSNFLIVPIQDLFGWRDRINVPAVVNDENWTWRLPWLVDTMASEEEARERAAFVRSLVAATCRG